MARTRLRPFAVVDELPSVLSVMAAALRLGSAGADQRAEIVRRHAARPGLVAHGAFTPDGVLVGFCYGFPSQPHGWWERQVAPRLAAAGTVHWLAGSVFEVTELHVRPDHQRHGLGRALLRTVLASAAEPRAVLSTRAGDKPARRLYLSLGFTDLTPPFRFTAGQPEYVVMGARLPLAPAPARESATDRPAAPDPRAAPPGRRPAPPDPRRAPPEGDLTRSGGWPTGGTTARSGPARAPYAAGSPGTPRAARRAPGRPAR